MVAPFKSYVRDQTFSVLYRLPYGGDIRLTRLYVRRQGVTQSPPYLDTNYVMMWVKCSTYHESLPGSDDTRVDLDAATNAARLRFVGKLGESSQFGSTITAERKATWGTVVSFIVTAARAAKAVSRCRLGEAAEILGFNPPTVRRPVRVRYKVPGKKARTRWRSREFWVMPDSRLVAKTVGNYWLWYSYGVKPLVGDIYNGMDILQRPMPEAKITASGSASSSRTIPPQNYWSFPQRYESKTSVRINAVVRVSNPNLWLANQMGLINPVQMINEGIPFSFVVDWFSNLSQVINQMTDFVGLEIAKPISTAKSSVLYTTTINVQGAKIEPVVVERGELARNTSIPQATLRFAYERFQWQRGANAISLLFQFLGKPPRKN